MEGCRGCGLMQPHMENPTAANCGAPKTDLAGALIASDNTKSLRYFQARSLMRRCAISFAMCPASAPVRQIW
jgi:hypothetical protein